MRQLSGMQLLKIGQWIGFFVIHQPIIHLKNRRTTPLYSASYHVIIFCDFNGTILFLYWIIAIQHKPCLWMVTQEAIDNQRYCCSSLGREVMSAFHCCRLSSKDEMMQNMRVLLLEPHELKYLHYHASSLVWPKQIPGQGYTSWTWSSVQNVSLLLNQWIIVDNWTLWMTYFILLSVYLLRDLPYTL